MNSLRDLYDRLAAALDRAAPDLLPPAARLVFAGVLTMYFWQSAGTKIGPGVLGFLQPTDGAYGQIFPRTFDAVGFDSSQLNLFHWAVATAGLCTEYLLPLLIVVGLFTRLAALGMIGFVAVQSMTDVFGHGIGGDDRGRWFDAASGSLIADQRALWILLLVVLVLHGAGNLSLDRLLRRRA
jgi:putative oxidoreductase